MRALVALGILALSVSLAAAQRAAPQDALGPTEGTGLVIVQVDFKRNGGLRMFGGGADDVRGRLVWLGDRPRVVEAAESKDLIVFSGLPPGPYRLDAVTANMKSGNLSWPLEAQFSADAAGFSVDVKAGTPIYLGKVTIVDQARMLRIGQTPPPTSTIENSPPLASEAWKRFLSTHGKTAWAARVREHLAGGGAAAVAAAPPAALPAVTPLERVEALVREADAAERNGTVRNFMEQKKPAIASAESDLGTHLETHPDDVGAMLMSVRLAWLRESTTPVVLKFGAGQNVAPPDDAFARLAAITDRVIALQPDNAAAYLWKARIAGIEMPSIKDGKVVKVPRDLPLAVVSARRAVELEPASVSYRDALATFLVMDDKPSEALDVLRPVAGAGGAPHPITSILSAWQALPVPNDAYNQRMMAAGLTDVQVDAGRITDYSNMRVRAYTVPTRMTEVEAFYTTRVKNFRLFEMATERDGPTRMTIFGQFLMWKDGHLEPATSKRQVEDAPKTAANGLMLVFTEFIDFPEENRTRFEGVTSGTFSQLTIINFVAMSR